MGQMSHLSIDETCTCLILIRRKQLLSAIFPHIRKNIKYFYSAPRGGGMEGQHPLTKCSFSVFFNVF